MFASYLSVASFLREWRSVKWYISVLAHYSQEERRSLPKFSQLWPIWRWGLGCPPLRTRGWCWAPAWPWARPPGTCWTACRRSRQTGPGPRSCQPASPARSRRWGTATVSSLWWSLCDVRCVVRHEVCIVILWNYLNCLRWQSQFQGLSIRNTCCSQYVSAGFSILTPSQCR